MVKKVYIVHCIDTEGPLNENLKTTFKRIYSIFGIKLKPTKKNLIKIQNKKINFGKKLRRSQKHLVKNC